MYLYMEGTENKRKKEGRVMHPDFFSYPQERKKREQKNHRSNCPVATTPLTLILSPHKECGEIHAPNQISDALTRGS